MEGSACTHMTGMSEMTHPFYCTPAAIRWDMGLYNILVGKVLLSLFCVCSSAFPSSSTCDVFVDKIIKNIQDMFGWELNPHPHSGLYLIQHIVNMIWL